MKVTAFRKVVWGVAAMLIVLAIAAGGWIWSRQKKATETSGPRTGLELYQARNYEAAEQTVRSEIAQDPTDATKHNLLANILRDAGKNDEAIAEYRTALEIDPRQLPARRNLISLYRLLGKPAEARQAAKEGLAIYPGNAELEQEAK